MPRADDWYRQTERELYHLPLLLTRLKNLRQRLEDMTPETARPLSPVRPGGEMTDSTFRCVESRLSLEEEISRLGRRIEMVEASLQCLSPEEREMCELIYLKGLGWREICDQKHISRSTLYERKNRIVQKVAICLGYLPVA